MRSLRNTRKTELSNCKTTRSVKSDENSNVKMCTKRSKLQKNGTVGKRQVLADKTNSGSDTNVSTSSTGLEVNNIKSRPKRTHNLPLKFNDHVLSPIGNKQNIVPEFSSTPLSKTSSAKIGSSKQTLDFKTSEKCTSRRAIDDLKTPEKSISRRAIDDLKTPEKTTFKRPIVQDDVEASPPKMMRLNTRSRAITKGTSDTVPASNKKVVKKSPEETPTEVVAPRAKRNVKKTNEPTPKIVEQDPPLVKIQTKTVTPEKTETSVNKNMTPIYKKKITLLNKYQIPTPDRLALYEFDFDPSEEPTKPKKKKVVRKTPATRKKIVKNNGEAALEALIVQLKKIQETQKIKNLLKKKKAQKIVPSVEIENVAKTVEVTQDNNRISSHIPEEPAGILSPIPKTRFCYSPRPSSPFDNAEMDDIEKPEENSASSLHVPDIQSVSCFSEPPAANSSMILGSARKPAASPWRVNYENQNRKWPCNFYVKSSMTPSYERDTFHIIGLDDNSNRSEELNYVSERPTRYVTDPQKLANWKQTSILSFYEESMKKSAKKRCHSPKKSKKKFNYADLTPPSPIKDISSAEPPQVTPEKAPELPPIVEKPTVDNCFGFDDSSEFDQENVSPVKIKKLQNINAIRGTASKVRGILKEINPPMNLPMRALTSKVLNVIAVHKEVIEAPKEVLKEPEPNEVLEEIVKVPEVVEEASVDQNADSSSDSEEDTAMDSTEPTQVTGGELALFEDPVDVNEPKVVHYTKPTRRSYGRKKKPMVTFQKASEPTAASLNIDEESDYMSDSSSASEKAKKKKKKKTAKSKKEEKEVDDWAAGFNSMLEEVDEYDLCIE